MSITGTARPATTRISAATFRIPARSVQRKLARASGEKRQYEGPEGKMHRVGVKGKAKGLVAEFADFQDGSEEQGSTGPGQDHYSETSQRDHHLIAPEREAVSADAYR